MWRLFWGFYNNNYLRKKNLNDDDDDMNAFLEHYAAVYLVPEKKTCAHVIVLNLEE